MTHASSLRATLSRSLRHLLPAALALATATCTQDSVGPSDTGVGYFTFRPTYQLAGGASLAQFGIVADSIHIRLTRPVDQLVLDTTVFFPADSTELHLALPVQLAKSPDTLQAIIEMSAGGVIIFSDTVQTEVFDGPPDPANIPQVTFTYVGPGTNIADIDITPDDTTIFLGDTTFFGATAFDALEAPVTSFYIGWSTSDTSIAKINANGRLIAPNARGTIRVIGITPTGIADSTTITFAPTPVIVTADSGNAQSAQAGDSLPTLLVARVKGADSLGIAGIQVHFVAVTAGGAVRDTFVVTDSTGRAKTRGVLGLTAGAYSFTATAVGTGLPARTFTATATAAVATTIAIQGGNAQVDTVAQLLPLPLAVHVTDAFTNPVAGVPVVFATVFGDGTVADDTVLTNASGNASIGYTLGISIGTDSITATIAGTSAFAIFHVTGVADAPVSTQEFGGGNQTVAVNTAYPESLLVKVFDTHDNPVAGAKVVWSVFSGEGTLAFDTTLTDSAGRATNALTADTLAGELQVEARALPLVNGITITNHVAPGAPTAIVTTGGNAQVDTIGRTLPLPFTVHLTDAFANDVPGATVYWARTAGNGSVSSDSTVTDSTGATQVSYTLGGTVSTDSITATIAGTSAFVVFSASSVAGAPAQTQEFGGGNQTVAVNTAYPESLLVKVFDSSDNPVAGAKVVWTIFSGQGTLAFDTTLTDSAGRATNALTAGTLAGELQVEVRALPIVNGITITNYVTAGAPSSMTIASGNGQSGPAGLPLPLWPEVRVADAFDNPVAGVAVAFAVTAGGGSIDSATATTDSTGRANSGEWTLGVAGLNTVRAVSAAIPTDTLLFDATALPAGTSKLWTGAADNVWTNPANWSPTGAPGLTDNIFVPASATSPVLGASTTITDLAIENGATLTVTGPLFTVGGNVDIGGTLAGTGTVTLTGSGSTLRGNITNPIVNISGTRSLNGPVSVASALNVTSGLFTTAGRPLTIGTNLTITGSGQLVMGSINDSVQVNGNVLISSSTTGTGDLSAGVLVIKGNFNQSSGSATGFAPSGTHRTRFLGSTTQTVNFANPGSAFSRFQEVEFGNPAGITINSTVTTMGVTTVSAGTVTGIGRTINLGGSLFTSYAAWQVSNTLWGQDPAVYPDSLPRNVTVFGAWTLTKAFKTDSSVTISSGGILTLNGHTMRVGGSLTQTGILRMKNGSDSLDVAGNVTVNSSISGTAELQAGVLVIGGNFTQTAGANDNFAADSVHRTRFDGAATQTVSFGSPAVANSHFATVDFDNAAGITLNSNAVALTDAIVSKGIVTGAGRTVTIGKDLLAGNTAWVVGVTNFTSTPTTFPGAFTGDVQFQTGATLTQNLSVSGGITVFNGLLDLNGHAVSVGTSVSLSGGGQVHMVNPLDSIDASGFGISTAASGQGHYTAGVIVLHGGNFVQAGDPKSFYASGTHRVKFDGSSPQTIFFASPDTGASRFEQLEIKNTSTVTANSNFAVHGPVTVNDGVVFGAGRTAFLAGGGIYDTLGGRWNVGTTIFQENPANLPLGLPGSVIWRASGSLSASTTIGGSFTIDEDTLYLGGHILQVVGDLTVGGSGVLPMVSAADSLIVTGNVTWSTTASHAGLLTAGQLLFTKNFTQTAGAPDNFAADTGLHVFIATSGTAPQLSFANPTTSRFGTLSVTVINGVNLATDVSVAGTFAEGNGTPTTVFSGLQHTLRVGGLDVDGATFDRVNVELHSDVNAFGFDNVTFLNQDAAVTQLSLELPGQAGDTVKLDNVAFSGTPTTGRYVYAADSVANDGVANIAFYNSTPLNGALFTGTEGSIGDTPNVLWSHLEWQVEPTVATEGLPIVPSPIVRAVDPSGTLLTGNSSLVTLQFFLDPSAGAASLSGNAVNAVAGVATFDSLAISMAGTPYALRASAPGLGISAATSSFTVDLPLPSGTTTAFNNGGGDNDWDNALNWTFGVPDSTDNVFVFPGQTATVNTPSRANTVTIGTGGTIVLNAPLAVDSSVTAGNTIAGGGELIAQGTGFLSGVVGGLVVTGSYSVPSGDQLQAQSINISGATASLDPGQAQITAIDSLRTEAGGVLNIGYPGANVFVQGLARFTGGPSSLTDGTLHIGGDFSQEENVGAFSPGPSFVTEFNGGGTQTATFLSPDTLSDHFAELVLTNGGTLHLAGLMVPILGNIEIQGGHVVVDTQAVVLGTITGATGAFMEGATLMIRDNFAFGGVYTVANTIFIGTGQTIQQAATQFDTVYVQGSASLAGNVTANAFYASNGGQFTLGGHRLDVVGDFGTFQTGVFSMTDPADTVMVGGSFYAAGGSTTGLLTDGLLQVAGNFIEGTYTPCCVEVEVSGPPPAFDAFRASGNHLTRLAGGTGTRIIYFATPVSATDPFTVNNSHFGNLELTDGTDTLLSTAPAAGDLTVITASLTRDPENSNGGLGVQGNATIGAGVGQFDLANLAISGALDFQATPAVYVVGSTVFFGDGQTIPVLPYNDIEVVLGQATLGGDLSVANVRTGISSEGPGFPGDLRLGGHTLTVNGSFSTVGQGTFTMDDPADSLDVSSGGMDLGGGVATGLSAGTMVVRGDLYLSDSTLVASGAHKTVFAGGSQQLWITAAHENGNRFQDVSVRPGAFVELNPYQVGTMTVDGDFWSAGYFQQASAGQKVVVRGDLYVGTSIAFVVDTVELHQGIEIDASSYNTQLTRYAGTGQVIEGGVTYQDVEVTGTALVDTSIYVNRTLKVAGSGQLTIGPWSLQVFGTFATVDSGTLVMADPGASLGVDTASFGGGNTTGLLTAGYLVTRVLIQDDATDARSYVSSGTHVTSVGIYPGGAEYRIQMASGGAGMSSIGRLELNDGGAGFPTRMIGHVFVSGDLIVTAGASGGITGDPGATLTVLDTLQIALPSAAIALDTLVLHGTIVAPNQTLQSQVVRFAGTGMVIPDSQNYSAIEVTGTATPEPAVIAQRTRIYGTGRLTINSGQSFAGNVLRTEENGTLEMAGPTAQLQVLDTLVMSGGSTAGLLRQGFLTLSGDLIQDGTNSPASFAVDSQMYTFFTNPAGQFVNFATPGNSASHFGFVNLQPNAAVSINATGTVPVWGEMNIQSGANLGSNAGIDVAQNMVSGSGSMVTAPLFIFRTGSAPDLGTTWNVARTAFAGADTLNIPQVNYLGDVEIWTLGRFVYPVTIGGTLRIGGAGTHAYASWSGVGVTANGLDVIDNSQFGMSNTLDSLLINGTAHFDGGYLADQLVAGTIVFGGDIVQDSTFLTQSFGASGTQLEFTPTITHKVTFASPDNSPWPYMTTGGQGGDLNLLIVGRLVVAGGGLTANGLILSGDTLENAGPLDAGGSQLTVNLQKYVGASMGLFANVGAWNVTTTHFTGGGGLPYSADFIFDTLIVSGPVQGQLSQLLKASYVEVTGPGNPRHLGDEPGELVLSGGDGNTTLDVSGDVVVRGAGAHISSFEGDLSATGDLTVDQDAYLYSGGSFGGASWSVAGNVRFDGASTRDSLVRGSLTIGKDFTQLANSSAEAFAADSSFHVSFTGAGTHKVSFMTPGPRGSGNSHFGTLGFGDESGLVLEFYTHAWVEGTLESTAGGFPTLSSPGGVIRTLVVRAVDVQGILFDHLQLHFENDGATGDPVANMDNVTFQNFLPTEDQFLVDLPGIDGQYGWYNFTFEPLDPGGTDTGHYIVATDSDGTGNVLTILLGTNQSGDPSNYFAENGASVNPFSP